MLSTDLDSHFQKLLDLAIDPESVIRKQDSRSLIAGVAGNKVGRDLAWNWLRGNWPKIYEYYLSGSISSAGRLVASCASAFNKEFELNELKEFYNERVNELGYGKRSTESAIQTTEANIAWMSKHYDQIVGWLEKKNQVFRLRL